MSYLSLSFLPRDKICFYCIHAREGVVLKKALLREAPPQGPTPFPFISGDRLLFRDRSLSITFGVGKEDFRGDHLIFRRTKGGISRN